MNVTGILWTFYPLLGLMAFIEFGLGLGHIFFCLPFFATLLPVVSGVSGSIASVYALLLHVPNRCMFLLKLKFFRTELLLQFISWIFAFGLFLTTTIEASRSGMALTELEASRHAFRKTIVTILAGSALIHLCSSTILTLYSAIQNKFRLSTIHWQFTIGIFTLILSYVYHKYCCVFFHTYFVTAIGFYALIRTLVPWHFQVRTIQQQLFAIVGAGLSVALLSSTSFGFFCWANRNIAVPWHFDIEVSSAAMRLNFWNVSEEEALRKPQGAVMRFCHRPEQIYMICERRLQFSTPYIWWTREQVQNEAEIVQILVYILLTGNAMALFFLFIYEAFC